MILYIITFILAAFILVSAFRNKILRQIGFRNILRRKATTFLVIFGSLIGTALIAGSLTLGDSFAKTTRIQAEKTLGEIDVELRSTRFGTAGFQSRAALGDDPLAGLFTVADIQKLESTFDKEKVDGVLPALVFSASIIKQSEKTTDQLSVSNSEILVYNPNTRFSSENINFNIEDNKTLVSEDIAQRLDLKKGDKIKVYTTLHELTLEVQDINTQKGASSFTRGNGSILVSRNTIEKEFNLPKDSYNRLFVSAKGSAFETTYNDKEFTSYIKEKVDKSAPTDGKWTYREYKAASTTGGSTLISNAFLIVSLVGVIAGILLIVNIYSMLAEERKSEMGTLRAIALTRFMLIKTFIYEGFVYSVIASAVGVLTGLGVGYILLNSIIALAKVIDTETTINIVFDTTPATWGTAFCLGLLITFGTALISSFRISKINIVSAIRNLPDETDIKRTKWTIVKIILQVLLLINAIGTGIFGIVVFQMPKESFESVKSFVSQEALGAYLIFLSVVFSSFMLSVLLGKLAHSRGKDNYRRYIVTFLNLPPLLLSVFIDRISLFQKVFESTLGISLLLFTGLTIVMTTTTIITYNIDILLKLFESTVGRIPRLTGIVRLALRYSAENKFRTGITILMFALVLFLVSFLSVFRITVDNEFEKFAPTSGYDAFVTANSKIDANKVRKDVEKLGITSDISVNKSVILSYTDITTEELYPDFDISLFGDPKAKANVVTFGYDDNFIKNNPIKLASRLPEFKNDEEAMKAALDTGKYVFLTPQGMGGNGAEPIEKLKVGNTVKIFIGDKTVEVIVAGLLDQAAPQNYTIFQYGMITGDKLYSTLIGNESIGNTYINNISFKLNAKGSRSDNIKQIQRALIPYNIADNLFSISEVFKQIANFFRGSIIILQGFLSFALFVGIAGVAIIMVRSVNQRKQQIGMLRSLGFLRSNVLISFFIEASFIIFLGIVIGIVSGALSANVFIAALNNANNAAASSSVTTTEIVVPYTELILIGIGVYIISIIFTLWPSYQASKLEPIEATNYLD